MKTICTPIPTLTCITDFIKVLLLAGLLVSAQCANATIRYVKAGATGSGSSWADASGDLYGTINASQQDDEVWVAEGTYTPPGGQEFVMKADVKIYGGFAGTETTPVQRNLSLHTSKLLPGTTGVVVRNNGNGLSTTALLDGFYITNATRSAVVNIGSSPAFANCTFAGNQNFYNGGPFSNPFNNIDSKGGAVLNDQSSSPSFTSCTFNSNRAQNGGALFNRNSSSAKLINCTFNNNSATNQGGSIYNDQSSSPVLNTCTFTGNTANTGGGMYCTNSSFPRLIQCTFASNSATTDGGGIFCFLSSCSLTSCTFYLNSSQNGGGLYNSFSSFTLVNCLLLENYASSQGGGIYNTANSNAISFTNCTFSGNIATTGGGAMYNLSSSNITIRNSIIYNNNSGVINNGYTPAISYSLVQDLTATTNGNISGATNPLFVNPVAASSGTVGDFRLQPCSPAINKGSNSSYAAGQSPDLSAITTDLDGNARIYNGGTVDMGAYERTGEPIITATGGIIYVKPGTTGTGESWSCATGDLQAAINAAGSGNQVWVAGGTYIPNRRADATGAITTGDRNNAFVLKADVKIYGGFAGTESSLSDRNLSLAANASILSGDLNGDDNGFTNNGENAYHVVVSAGNIGTALLDGFTIQSGNCDGSTSLTINGESPGSNGGAGINCSNSSPALNNLVIKGNAGRYGAGLALSTSSPVITNSFITGNAGFYGGGIIASNCGASIINVLISGNTAVEQGGAMYNEWAVAPTLTNVTITGNTANNGGGALYNNLGAALQMRNCIVYGNNTGIYNNNGAPAIQYSLVQDETSTANGNIDGGTNPLFANQPAPGLNTGGNYRLQGCSPAINAGNSSFYNTGQIPDLTTVTTDLNNATRIQGTAIDMGVYEFTGNPGGADFLAITGDAATQTISGSTPYIAAASPCRLITTLQPIGGLFDYPLAGSVNTKVWIENSQPATYVKRHYEVNPANYSHMTMGIATLYFTQAEFDAYNAVNAVKLPASPGDASGKANLIIRQYAGYSFLGTGQPNTYSGTVSTIDPDNNNIIWNSSASRWEVSFVFIGYSGFFVTSQQSALPLTLLNFSGHYVNGYSHLQWQTADEANTKQFVLERSTDASTFTSIATIAAAGAGNNSYNYNDPVSFNGKLYYRLKMVDIDGRYSYSAIVTLTNTGNNVASLYPNPVNEVVYLQTSNGLLQSKANVYHVNGQYVQTITITATIQAIPVLQLTRGIYIIKLENGIAMKFIKQ